MKHVCVGCVFVKWQVTKTGRLSPTGRGVCRHPKNTEGIDAPGVPGFRILERFMLVSRKDNAPAECSLREA